MRLDDARKLVRKYPLESVVGGIVALVALIVAISGLFSDGEGDPPTAGPPATSVSNPAPTSSPERAVDDLLAVEPVECGPLLTSEEIDAALGLTDLPGIFLFNRGEVCVHTPNPDENVFVRTEPGHPADFEPGATMFGVEGEFVEGVGTTALWFSGADPDSGAEVGALSVSEQIPQGWLYFRVVLARPDADHQTRLDAARTLALAMLPRFPGVEIEPELVAFETEDSNPAFYSYSANLEARVESGEWTVGEGLLATLQALTGQADPADVLLNPDLIDQPAVSIVPQAYEFVGENPDDPVAQEIDLILGQLFPTNESLQEQGAIAAPTARAPHGAYLVRQLAQEDPEQQQQQEAYCQDVWGSSAPCLVEFPLEELETDYSDRYQLLVPFVTTNWDATTPMDTAGAIVESAKLYESIGDMPRVQVLFTPEHPSTVINPGFPDPDRCQVALGLNVGSGSTLRQRVAVAIAYCLIHEKFGDVWFENGLAWYLGARVYPHVNLEHDWSGQLENEELSTSILVRSYTNWSLFEFIHPFVGDEKSVLGIAGGLPQSAAPFMHQYYLGLTDANVGDLGDGTIPYSPMASDLSISGPVEVPMAGQPYGVMRLHVSVDGGMKACAEIFSSGAVESSWRPGAPGSPGSWDSLPTEFDGESVFVVTTTGSASLDLVVTKVVPDDEECEEDPESPSSPPPLPPPVNSCCGSDHYRETPPARQGE